MDAYRIGLTIRARSSGPFDLEKVVPVLHNWIQGQLLAGHLLIDVADYLHVEGGPGIVLVGHEANISLSAANGAVELTYQRKRPFGSRFSDRLTGVVSAALSAARLLQHHLPELVFQTDNLRLHIADKLSAPAEPQTLEAILPDVNRLFAEILGSPVQVEYLADPLKPFAASIRLPSAPAIADLLQRAAAATT